MKKSPKQTQLSDQNSGLIQDVNETRVPSSRSVRAMQSLDLDQTQEAETTLNDVSETMTYRDQTKKSPSPDELSLAETDVYVEPGFRSRPAQNSIDDTMLHTSGNVESSPSHINVHAQWSDLIGSELGGCRVERILGQGGMGVVFKGRHLVLDIDVAIKCLPPHAASLAAQERFGLEARVAAKLSHPNVVSVYHAGTERGIHFIVMELIEGESLEDKIRRNGLLNVNEALGYCIDICKALDYAERQGVVHRDLKPGNILVNHDHVAKLADLGLVKMMNQSPKQGALTHQGVAMGTPHYMAPEQVLDAQSVDHRADLYSLGCTLFQMVCGQTVFASSNVRALLNKHLSEIRPKAKEINPELPKGLSELIERLLNPDPAQRPSSAALVEKEIYALFDQWATLPNPIILPSQKNRSRVTYHLQSLDLERKKNQKLSYLMITLSIVFALGFVGLYFSSTSEPTLKPDSPNAMLGLTDPVKHSASQVSTVMMQEQKLLLHSERAEQIARRAMNMVGTSESRLIKTPQSASEYYWNSVIYRFELQRPQQLEALIKSFSQGLDYLDIAEEIAQVSTLLYGPMIALQKLQELLVKQYHPALKLVYLSSQKYESLAKKKDYLKHLQTLRQSDPKYLPVIIEEINLLKSSLHEGLLPIYEQLFLLKKLQDELEAQSNGDLALQLNDYYYQDTQVRQKVLFVEQIEAFLRQHNNIIEQPLNMSSTVQAQTAIISVYPNGSFYNRFKSIKYSKLKGDPLSTKQSNDHQEELREKAKNLNFKRGNLPSNHSLMSVLQFTLPFDYQGAILFELVDEKNQVNYLVKTIDLLGDHYRKLEDLSENQEWYNVPMKGVGLSAIGTYAKRTNTFTLFLNPVILTQFSSLTSSVEFVLRAAKSQKEIYRSKAEQDIKNGTQLTIEGMNIEQLKQLHPIVEIHLKLKNNKAKRFTAPLWECFQREPDRF